MIDFDLKKKWIKDAIDPKDLQAYKLSDADITGGWRHIDDNTCYKIVERMIGYYKRRLLLTCKIVDRPDGYSDMILVKAEEIFPQ